MQLSYALTALAVLTSAVSAAHALLNKRDPRAALGWLLLSILVPLIGPLIYLVFGVNRPSIVEPAAFTGSIDEHAHTLDHALDRVSAKLGHYPCSLHNRVEILRNGEQAYPAMLHAIENARNSVLLSSYIFDTDDIGKAFITALSDAVARGVMVRVLIDSFGSLYSFPHAVRLLRKAGVRASRFLPLVHRNSWLLNMRNHRKILAVDGSQAFVGGMNIGNRHVMSRHRGGGTADVQFLIEGEAAIALTDIFCRDWQFATGELLQIEPSADLDSGGTACRPISDGPGPELGTLPKLLLGLIGSAKSSVTIVTPYFLPPPAIVGALIGASLRDVRVRILLPEKNNLPYVKWATEHGLAEILESSIEVYYQPSPFSHTKMLLIDDDFLQIGSYNMDSRSLRLNFELAVNIFDLDLRRDIDAQVEEKISRSVCLNEQYLTAKPLAARIRNAIAWLSAPYL
jgi:cardiolipin synthase